MTVACRWPHLRYYWDLFNDHPAYGIGESLEVGYASNAEIIASPAVSDIPDTEKSRPTSHSHTEEECGQSVPLSDSSSSSTSSPESSGDTSDEEGRPLSSTKKRRKHVRSASCPKRKRLEQVKSKGPEAVGPTRKKSTQHEFLTTMTATQRELQAERLAFQDEQRRRQQEFECGVQERSEKHSANLQQQMVETASKLQEQRQRFQNEISQNMMTFQANLFKNLFGQPEKKEQLCYMYWHRILIFKILFAT